MQLAVPSSVSSAPKKASNSRPEISLLLRHRNRHVLHRQQRLCPTKTSSTATCSRNMSLWATSSSSTVNSTNGTKSPCSRWSLPRSTTAKAVYDFVQRQLGQVTQKTDTPAQDTPVDKEAPHESKKSSLHSTKARIKSTAAALKTTVDKSSDQLSPEASAKAAALAKHKAQQLASEVDELIRKAEAALAVPIEFAPGSTPTPAPANVEVFVLTEISDDPNVYAAPLPIGFEPPPGFSKPKPKLTPKPAQADVLPLIAPAVSDVAVSEPVISHLAGTIDDLASYLKANPAAAEKAKGILDTARTDLTELATRFDKIKEDEKHELEAKLDEQAREYSTKLLELELESQDKLALQREDYEKYVGEEKMKLVHAYRERLETELKAQTELMNDRLKEAIIAQGIELQRRWIREVRSKSRRSAVGDSRASTELATGLQTPRTPGTRQLILPR
ncbi:mitochondrial inner membrane protein-domain-containing protein [Chiua virens]|nr:mitochondrial inner membrane protein-domain-containing protein [Chiua virens]